MPAIRDAHAVATSLAADPPHRRPRLADILQAYGADYLSSRGARSTPQERRVLAQLTACRTAALGGHRWECDACGHVRVAYNSCRNRHCPTCGGAARARWLDRLLEDVLPVTYFHLVFTLPHELSSLALGNRRQLYGLLFRTAWEALQELAADPRHLGAQVGAVMVLHTWGQNLEHHPHVHCVATGGGLAADAARWVSTRSERFFLPVVALSRLFRGKFLAGLKQLYRRGELKLTTTLQSLADARQFERWLTPLHEKEWVVHIQPPPQSCHGPDAVLKYLARYVAGAAISDQRLLKHEAGQVTFHAKNYRQGRQRRTLTLPGREFVRRWLLHVLPRGFTRIRYYGLLANVQRGTLLPRCRELCGQRAVPNEPENLTGDSSCVGAEAQAQNCPACGRGQLQQTDHWPRPSWRELWRQEPLARGSHRQFQYPAPSQGADTS